MKTFLLTSLLGCSSLFASAQVISQQQFDNDHTVDLLVVYDDSNWEYAESQAKRDNYAQEVANSINLVLKNSNINYNFRIAGTYHWAGYKSTSIDGGLNDAQNNTQIKEERKKAKADIVLFLTENQDSNSGAAVPSAIHSDAYSCVRLSMAASAYTAAHEIGHVLGANHSDSPYEQQPSDHPWAKGFISPEGYMTVLCSMGTCVPIYSGLNSYWETDDGKRIKMGDDKHNNVDMILQNLPRAIRFGDHLDENLYYAYNDNMLFNKDQQQAEVRVVGNQFMMINSDCNWINQVSPAFCNGEETIKFSIDRNDTGNDRVGSIILSGDANTTKTIKVTQTAAEVNFDCDNGTYESNNDLFLNQAQFIRTFYNTSWQSLYIPFIWRYNDWKNYFDVAEIKTIEATENGEAVITIVPLDGKDLQAHTPYMIRAKKADRYAITLNYINSFAAGITSTEYTAGNQKFTFTGTYTGVAGQDMLNRGFYGMSGGVLAPTNNVNAKLKPFRWYLNITDNKGLPLTAPLKIKMVELDSDATGIEDTRLVQPSFNVYDLNGRLLKKNTNSTKGMPAGIYIIDGKKVII